MPAILPATTDNAVSYGRVPLPAVASDVFRLGDCSPFGDIGIADGGRVGTGAPAAVLGLSGPPPGRYVGWDNAPWRRDLQVSKSN